MLPAVLLSVALLALPPGVDPALFPDVDKHTPAEIELAGLATLYPGRILHAAPQTMDPGNKDRLPKVVDLARNTTYLRVYDLAAAGAVLTDLLKNKPTLIIDLRYVTSDADSAKTLADIFAKAGLDSAPVHGVGTVKEPLLPTAENTDPRRVLPVVLAIVNSQTSGPLEAWLEAFQEKESVLAVGTNTAGQAGAYHPFADAADYYIIEGELRPASGSIVGTGLHPRFAVDVTKDQDYRAYTDVERGNALDTLLRHERTTTTAAGPAATTTATATTPTPATAEDLTDPSLQRAVDVVAALQILGRVPPSPASTTGKSSSTPPATSTSSTPAQH